MSGYEGYVGKNEASPEGTRQELRTVFFDAPPSVAAPLPLTTIPQPDAEAIYSTLIGRAEPVNKNETVSC